ncbi:DUF934 domain-containing protein [Crenobacter cavernae]|uniref:DUF934 domain-containing protein n=1 Tax=Crenobacter cavernae TaxID=2290923 RepID=A0ABY0FFT3_9NEIS|nr:DUF934 domain-containing protein [Crenobacter cavernae]RXZ45165.1 DUF934 domain-containing protein [Crenobacter cavernae]
MQNIIKDGAVLAADAWQLVRPDAEGQLTVPDAGDVIVPLSAWLAEPERWASHDGRVAVWLASDDEPAEIAASLDGFALVAVDFPAFTDGRGYSIGRLLRERYGFAGELRAIGDVWEDHLHYLWQVGFNAFEIKDGKAVEGALAALGSFTDRYQATYREPQPLFRRHRS